MKPDSTLFLRGVVLLIGAAVVALCVLVLPVGIRAEDPDGYRPILQGMYVTAIPFFMALYQALKLLGYIDKNEAFSDLSVKALTSIKYCALVIGALFTIGMPYIFMVADKDDAPGVVALGLVVIFASLVVATFAALLQRILRDAIDIKSENELTV
ncbi:MAG: hypothetical protein K0S20_368 [Patescibacteria group bacterium]|jgi:hypothetical protein|nr:hypothetical protein [Patescibacteria group bacterium]